MAQSDEALRYKLEGRGFDFRWGYWDFSFTYSFRPHYGTTYLLGGIGDRCVVLTSLLPSFAV
jgi:hypothetical protein